MNALIQDRSRELAELCRRFGVKRLALFGSALTAQFNETHSDLDFLVEFKPLPSGEYAKNYFGLLEALEALFGKPVDLLEAQAIRNPYIKREIDATQETVYGA